MPVSSSRKAHNCRKPPHAGRKSPDRPPTYFSLGASFQWDNETLTRFGPGSYRFDSMAPIKRTSRSLVTTRKSEPGRRDLQSKIANRRSKIRQAVLPR
jgi:hypothetical protein